MNTAQKPIHSGYNATTTAAGIAAGHNLAGKIAIVTGGNSGVGFETARTLADAGAQVVIGARDANKAQEKLQHLNNISFISLDLADPSSVGAFAKAFLSKYTALHFLVNNAGIFRPPQLLKDKRGYELQLGVNHLGHFELTGHLWPALKQAKGARVVTVSSVGHRRKGLQLDDPNFEQHPYDKMNAYGQSKTANSLFAVQLDRIGEGHRIRSFAVHPGAIQTDIFRFMTDDERQTWNAQVKTFKTPQQGAATTVWCALSHQLDGMGGVYCEDCDIAELLPDDSPAPRGVRFFAVDPVNAAALWQFSEKATGMKYSG
ncbi:SDR family NAD(P)-dependent oxidoreductase [Puia sp.]|jgi:NAD(P)-dependent dehydrogenase (short-subunit alcohol dehydrogenase family)|uniref:SDR family NAD(P)-dependent oxidoreductase n=1 Tax=Puia sp. TaxID=2045100 RepID=UPI002F412B1B